MTFEVYSPNHLHDVTITREKWNSLHSFDKYAIWRNAYNRHYEGGVWTFKIAQQHMKYLDQLLGD